MFAISVSKPDVHTCYDVNDVKVLNRVYLPIACIHSLNV